eukprot:6186523-Pleurochrysis_carterae.AAC.3
MKTLRRTRRPQPVPPAAMLDSLPAKISRQSGPKQASDRIRQIAQKLFGNSTLKAKMQGKL